MVAYFIVEKMEDESIHHTAIKICEDFMSSPSYQSIFEDIQKLVSTPSVKSEDFKETILKAMDDNGLQSNLRNNVYYWLKSKKKGLASPFDPFFRKAQIHWDKRIHKSLNSMCSELGVSLAKTRANSEREEIAKKWSELSNYEVEIHKYRPVYAPKDFLEVLLNLKGPTLNTEGPAPNWEYSQIPLKVKTLQQLKALYSELSRGEQLLGTNSIFSSSPNYTNFEAERIQLGETVLVKNYAPLAQEFLKRGCPQCLRAKIWTLILGAQVKQRSYIYFQSLKEHVLQLDLMTDKLIIKDINLTASNDDQYFVFEDVLFQVMLCFSRDHEIFKELPNQPGFMQVLLKGKQNLPENTIVFPPNGVIPFHGFSMYAAPFCYLFDDPVQLYFVFRAFYLRYWHRLHRVCGNSQGVVSLCLQFEKLLQCYEPNLWHHFKKCHIHPVRVVIKWIMRAFSGHLPPEQLLNLWDLILAYDSLEIIPLLCLVILVFRKDNLMKVTSLQHVEAVLADLSSISVIPLLQMALLKK